MWLSEVTGLSSHRLSNFINRAQRSRIESALACLFLPAFLRVAFFCSTFVSRCYTRPTSKLRPSELFIRFRCMFLLVFHTEENLMSTLTQCEELIQGDGGFVKLWGVLLNHGKESDVSTPVRSCYPLITETVACGSTPRSSLLGECWLG